MDFLRLRLPGLHQALRGALDSFSAFVSYLVGDTVPTVERQTQAAEELGEVTEGKVVGEEAQEVLEGLRSGQSEGVEAPEETRRCQEGSLAGEQTWGWRADSSARPQAERQDTGSWKAAEDARGQEPSVPLKPEAEPGTHRDRSSNTAQEIWEHGEEEASSGEPLRTCEQKEEEEEVVRAAESGMAEGVESQPTWHSEPGGNAGTEGQHVTEDSKEIDWVAKDMVAEIEWFGAKGIDKEEERMVPMRDGERARAQGTQCPGAESEDQAMLSREAWTVSDREGADSLGVQGTEYGSDPGDNFPGTTGRVWVLEEADKGDQQDEVDEKREAEVRFPIQTLEAERTGEMTEGHIAEEEAMGEQETEGSFEDEERQDLAIRDNGVSLEEEVRAEESSREKRNSWATEPTLVLDTEAKDEPDWEDSPEVSTEELFVGERSEAAQMTPEVLRVKVTEGQDPELVRHSQALTKQLEEGQKGQEETSGAPDLSPERVLSLKEYPGPVGFAGPELEAWGNWSRGVDRRNSQEVKADAEAGKEQTATEQAVEIRAEGGQEAQQPEVFGSGGEEALTSVALNPELEGSQGAEAGTEESVEESKPTENEAAEEEAVVPWEADGTCRKRRLEEVTLSLQDSEDTETSYLAEEIIVGIRAVDTEEGPKWEAGLAPETELGKAWCSEGRGEAGRGTELEETTEKQSGQEVGLVGSAEKVSGYDIQEIDGTEEGEQAEMETSVMAEDIRGTDGVTLGSQAERAEGSITPMETEGLLRDQMLLEEEAGGGQSREQKVHNSEGEIQTLDDSSDQEGQQTHQIPTVAVPGPLESAEATAGAPGDVHSNWNEALLPGSRLDVSVPRSRVLLSRSSSRRRSRPSFHRISVPEPQCDPPSPQPQAERPVPEQSSLQLEETPELSATKPEGTPVPARRKMLGRGFGFAHPGMMQELQARLSQPKPQ
ncbi:apolipoprotein B receptor [Mus musculus]|uniref:Apolipoprotein B receptor n=2 Tax=Mus musculus TaxID=10090 RepID=APOBR_MOUSE|nr:apolipoprotein B receptor [Mus musculus]Q8VBT6.1 RecName: Full=Apolipoprotein B receptor; AltName: Full=Apolipoprotein B-100 receptor; Short=Apolipoprotein B48 receptor; Short=apoB-48R [Mus musculus]AAH30718.1 Apolipoprotein B48 receptor [Mus musculus]AAL54862.1 apolipoprotein B48 receptor [Mus musculus]AAL54863.1 apolipoprotein B48 receptor [Mus musculus]|eukprot:NP_612183.1 apolipoprotein B receptor [Mus musculus]